MVKNKDHNLHKDVSLIAELSSAQIVDIAMGQE